MSDETERLVDRYGQARAIGGVIGSRDARFALLAHIRAIERERDELQSTFDLRWKADLRAIERWREATGKELVIPDRSDLCVWLLERIAALEEDLNRVTRGTWSKEIARQSARIAALEAENERLRADAERYAWLRDWRIRRDGEQFEVRRFEEGLIGRPGKWYYPSGEILDAAIDAERKP